MGHWQKKQPRMMRNHNRLSRGREALCMREQALMLITKRLPRRKLEVGGALAARRKAVDPTSMKTM